MMRVYGSFHSKWCAGDECRRDRCEYAQNNGRDPSAQQNAENQAGVDDRPCNENTRILEQLCDKADGEQNCSCYEFTGSKCLFLFHINLLSENILSVQAYCTVADTALQFESVRRSDDKDRHDIVLVSHNRPGFKSKSPAFFSAGALSIYAVVAMMDELVSGQ